MQDHQRAMLKSLVAVAWADNDLHAHERAVIDALIAAYELNADEAKEILAFADTKPNLDQIDLTELSASDRRALIQTATMLTYADGEQSDSERALLTELSKRLKLDPAEAKTLIEAAEARAKVHAPLLKK